MARIEWDRIEDRRFETGIDRGVLFPLISPGVAWSGLVSVTETGSSERKSYYHNGLKVFERVVPGVYSAKIEAFTYPDILEYLLGLGELPSGVRYHDGRPKPFHLAYRTLIGDAVDGIDHAYRIHLVYNLLATAEDSGSKTVGAAVEPNTLAWTVSGSNKIVSAGQPLDHISIDSRHVSPEFLQSVENQIYGTAGTDPVMPNPLDFL